MKSVGIVWLPNMEVITGKVQTFMDNNLEVVLIYIDLKNFREGVDKRESEIRNEKGNLGSTRNLMEEKCGKGKDEGFR